MEQATATVRDYMELPPQETQRGDVDRRATRWVVFVGDVLPDRFKRNFERMKMGGEYLGQDYRTLHLTKGILRRCQITPLTVGRDYQNDDALGDQKDKAIADFQSINPLTNLPVARYYVECLPGDELAGILSGQQGEGDIGIREVENLRGVSVNEMDARNIQRTIFPNWDAYLLGEKEMPNTIAGLEKYLLKRKSEIGDSVIREIIDTLLQSAAQFRRWGTMKLDRQARLVKAPPTEGGKVYGWEEVHLELFDQLELNKEEFLMKKAERVAEPQTGARSEEIEELRRSNQELRDMMRDLIQLQRGNLTPAPVDTPRTATGRPVEDTARAAQINPVDYSGQVCADTNARNEPCGAKVIKEIEGKFYCTNHPKAE